MTDEDREAFASALADELIAELPEGEHQVLYDVVPDDRYGDRPSAGNWDITEDMIDRALKSTWGLRS